MTLINIAYLLAGAGLLSLGGESLVRGSVCAGIRLGLTPLAAGLTIVAFGTSMPELIVNLRAVGIGVDGLAAGNVVGSNIANIGLILGLSILIRPVMLDIRVVRNDIHIMLAATILGIAFLADGRISRVEGIVSCTAIILYIYFNLKGASQAREISRQKFAESLPAKDLPVWKSGAMVIGGLLLLSGGGFVFVHGAVGLAESMGVPPAVIGLSVVAVGTSLPELATSAVAAFRGYGDLAIGNVLGSNIFNLFFVLGLTASIAPLERGAVSNLNLLVMLVFAAYFLRLVHIPARAERWEGLVLVAGFGIYIVSLVP